MNSINSINSTNSMNSMNSTNSNRVNWHIHSTFSDGKLSPKEIVDIANTYNCTIGISDHLDPRFGIMNNDLFNKYLEELNKYNIYKSIEISLFYELPIDINLLSELDYIIAGVHDVAGMYLFDDIKDIDLDNYLLEWKRLLLFAFQHYNIDIWAHPTLLLKYYRGKELEILYNQWWDDMIEATKVYNIAIEISSRWKTPIELLARALELGAKFSIGSDAHKIDEIIQVDYSYQIIKKLNIPQEQLFTPKKI